MNERKYFIELNDEPNDVIQYLGSLCQDTRLVTLQVFAKLSVEELDWQYKPGWNTIGALLAHISAIEHFFRIEFIEDRKLTAEENEVWQAALDMGVHLPKLIGSKSVQEHIQALTDSGNQFIEALREVDLEKFTKRLPDYDKKNGANLAWILYHKIEDEIYHRGQISMIRKLYKEHTSACL